MEFKRPTLNSSTTKWIWFVVIILLCVNAMFERTSFSSILKEISSDLCENGCSKKEEGFIQTFYFIMIILSSPLLGYLGDRISRKYLLIGGLCIWSAFVLAMTFMPDYWSFVIINGLSAVGMTMYSNLVPAMLADLFSKDILGWIYGIYFLSIPAGIGIGMFVPHAILAATGDWRNSLRLTPGITLLGAIVIFFLKAPPRGGNDEEKKEPPASCWSDLKYIFSVKSFVLHMFGSVCAAFIGQTIPYWSSTFYREAIRKYNLDHGEGTSPVAENNVALLLGIITIVGGFVGISIGASLSQYFRDKFNRFDPLLIGTSFFLAVPFVCASGFVAHKYIIASYVLYAFYNCSIFIFLPISMNVFISVILPSKRAFSTSLVVAMTNAFGSASSPTITGLIIDWINPTKNEDDNLEAMQLAFIPSYALLGIGGILYTLIVFFIVKDREPVEKQAEHDITNETMTSQYHSKDEQSNSKEDIYKRDHYENGINKRVTVEDALKPKENTKQIVNEKAKNEKQKNIDTENNSMVCKKTEENENRLKQSKRKNVEGESLSNSSSKVVIIHKLTGLNSLI